jgi:hypothetical protein
VNRILAVLFFIIIHSTCFSQDIKFFNHRPTKNLHITVAGEGGLLSFNQEKLRLISFKSILVTKIGLGVSIDSSFTEPMHGYMTIPASLSLCIGERKHLFEMGMSATVFLRINDPVYEFSVSPIVGYRYQPLKENKLVIRIYAAFPYSLDFSTYYKLKETRALLVPLGISIGKCF